MKPLRSLLLPLVAFALACSLSVPAWAGPAQDYVELKHKDLVALLQERPSPERNKKVTELLDVMIDFDKLARDSLATHWQARTDQERADFVSTLKRLVKKNYEKNIQKTLNYAVSYTGEEAATEGVVVHSTVERKKKTGELETISIDYRLHQKDGRWMIFDVITEESSMLNNYRNQFNKVINKNGWGELMRRLTNKLNER